MNERVRLILFFGLIQLVGSLFAGCAVHYYEASTGTEHLWGFGHMKMRIVPAVDNPKIQAVAVGIQTIGARVDTANDTSGLSFGYSNTSVVTIVASDTALRLDTVGSDPFTLRLGTQFPDTEVALPR